MSQKKNGLTRRIEAFNDRLYTRIRKNQEVLDNMGTGALCVEATERLKAFFKIK